MTPTTGENESILNENHRRHLLISCQHIDKLLSDIEAILNASAANSPFPKYTDDTSPVQRKVTRDYLSRIRAQLVRVLASLNIEHPGAKTSSVFAIHTILSFISISVEELKPKYMRGYGEVHQNAIPELNGISNELEAIVMELDSYLMRGLGQDFQGRLEKLEAVGDEINLLKEIERVIAAHGLVEFRTTLSIIVERLEDKSFEVAFFGRVSAGKSSLLNYILQKDVLPVGVNPITAVPTRILFGLEPKLIVRFADNKTQIYEIEKLAEFATEQQNTANEKNVTRLNIELPAPRLQDGVVFVDTPGLGSLAGAGASETIAYLPRCDLGVVLVDAASTLTTEDLSTIQTLFEASVPAVVLLSKADLLSEEDRAQALKYIETQVQTNLGVNLSAHAVSSVGEFSKLTDNWFEQEILPLYSRHQELARQSIRRKIGSLREALETSLKLKLKKNTRETPVREDELKEVEAVLRRAAGKIEETQTACQKLLDEIPKLSETIIRQAAAEIVERWSMMNEKTEFDALFDLVVIRATADAGGKIYDLLKTLAQSSAQTLDATAKTLGVEDAGLDEKPDDFLREMPRFDAGAIQLNLRFSLLTAFGEKAAKYRVEKELEKQTGAILSEALSSYRRILGNWIRRVTGELQRQFNARASWYRTQIESLTDAKTISSNEEELIRRDIESLQSNGIV